MATTWWLSSSESATDVKELVPEFFYLPEFLNNSERMYILQLRPYRSKRRGSCVTFSLSYTLSLHVLSLSSTGFNFGECQTGELVDDVKLPPWAKGHPRLFILKHRQVCALLGIGHMQHFTTAWFQWVGGWE